VKQPCSSVVTGWVHRQLVPTGSTSAWRSGAAAALGLTLAIE